VFGYDIHKNITSQFEIGSTRNSLYDPFDITGDAIQVATPPGNLFDHTYVLNILKGDDLSNPIFSPRETITKVESVVPKAPSISIPDISDIIPGIQLGEFVDVTNSPKEEKVEKTDKKSKK